MDETRAARQRDSRGSIDIDGALRRELLAHVGDIEKVTTIVAGIAHAVTRVQGKRGSVYIKKNNPITFLAAGTAPSTLSLRREWEALQVFHQASPKTFPRPIAVDLIGGVLITGEAMRPKESLERILLSGPAPAGLYASVGRRIAKVHCATKHIAPINLAEDPLVRANHLRDRFGIFESVDAQKLMSRLQASPSQLLMADLAPKNLGFTKKGSVRIVDFEMAHHGDPMFDLGYVIAHLALHAAPYGGEVMSRSVQDTSTAYAEVNPSAMNVELLQKIIAGTLLYRTAHPVWNYEAHLIADQKKGIAEHAAALLAEPSELGWDEFSTRISPQGPNVITVTPPLPSLHGALA